MEIVKANISCFENLLEIEPIGGFKDNSSYEITINNLKDLNGNTFSKKITLITRLSPFYSSVHAVKALVSDIDIPTESIVYNIREASRFADYIAEFPIDENNISFAASQFVKYRAAYESLLAYAVKDVTSTGISGKVGDISFDEKLTNRDFSKLLKSLEKEVDDWHDALRGYDPEGRAKPKKAIRGYFNDIAPIYRPVRVSTWRGLDNR
jgi:hypothetical protein